MRNYKLKCFPFCGSVHSAHSLTIWFTIVAMMIFSIGRRHTISVHWMWCCYISVVVVVIVTIAAATNAATAVVIASICGPNENYSQQQIITNLWIPICRTHIAVAVLWTQSYSDARKLFIWRCWHRVHRAKHSIEFDQMDVGLLLQLVQFFSNVSISRSLSLSFPVACAPHNLRYVHVTATHFIICPYQMRERTCELPWHIHCDNIFSTKIVYAAETLAESQFNTLHMRFAERSRLRRHCSNDERNMQQQSVFNFY